MKDQSILDSFSTKELVSLLQNPIVEKRHPLVIEMNGLCTLNLFGAGLSNHQWKYYAQKLSPLGIEKIHFGNIPTFPETITVLEKIDRFADLVEIEFDNEIYHPHGMEAKTYEWKEFLGLLKSIDANPNVKRLIFKHVLISDFRPLRKKVPHAVPLNRILEMLPGFSTNCCWKPAICNNTYHETVFVRTNKPPK